MMNYSERQSSAPRQTRGLRLRTRMKIAKFETWQRSPASPVRALVRLVKVLVR